MKKWTIGKRISFGYASVLATMIAICLFASARLNVIGVHTGELIREDLPSILSLTEIQAQGLTAKGVLLQHILTEEPERIEALESQAKQITVKVTELFKVTEAAITTDEERALYAEVTRTRKIFNQARDQVFELSRKNLNREAFELYRSEVEAKFSAYSTALKAQIKFNEENGVEGGQDIANEIASSKLLLYAGLGLAILLAGSIGYVVIHGTNHILTATARTLDEGAQQVTAAAGQVSSASQSLAEGSSEQAASLEETSSSLEEMASMAKRNAENVHQAKIIAGETRQAADVGTRDMQEMKSAMGSIKSSSDDVAKIIKTIDEIAFQTNILALNAAVEAARAGEAGAGFAVVADEVRNLAQRSAESARETASKIEVAIANSVHGVQISEKVALSLESIAEKTRRVDAIVAEIATATHEQHQGISQVNLAVSQMDKVTQSNASNAEETAAAAEELNSQATVLSQAVGDLNTLVSGQSRTAKGAHSHKNPPPSEPSEEAPTKAGASFELVS